VIYLTREPHVLPFTRHVPMLRGAPWRRVAVLGDSIAEGVREPHDGFRDLSWIERIVEPLGAVAPGLTVMNLGQRDLRASEVRELQLPAALRFHPDLAIVAAGGNDALRRSFSPERVAEELDAIVAPLREAGADILMLELMDIVASGLVPREYADALGERMSGLAQATREVAARHGAMLVEMRGHPVCADPGVYASDRLHLNARGHAIVASEAIRVMSDALVRRAAA
jgi:lysophospholipase L1-like esterase